LQIKYDKLEDLFKPIKSNLISTELINQILKKPIPNLLHIETRGKKKDFKSKLNSEITVPKAKDVEQMLSIAK
jgi:hypothetical protein